MTDQKFRLRLTCLLPLAATALPRPLVNRALAAGIKTLGELFCAAIPHKERGEGDTFPASDAERMALDLATEPENVAAAYRGLVAAFADTN